jgi:hypothetical protein
MLSQKVDECKPLLSGGSGSSNSSLELPDSPASPLPDPTMDMPTAAVASALFRAAKDGNQIKVQQVTPRPLSDFRGYPLTSLAATE